jgi:hypothetical protein
MRKEETESGREKRGDNERGKYERDSKPIEKGRDSQPGKKGRD